MTDVLLGKGACDLFRRGFLETQRPLFLSPHHQRPRTKCHCVVSGVVNDFHRSTQIIPPRPKSGCECVCISEGISGQSRGSEGEEKYLDHLYVRESLGVSG